MKRERVGMIVGVVAMAVVTGSGMAESIWVKAESVDIRAGKGAVYDKVGTAKKGTELTVVGHEGKWLKVSIPGVNGAAATEGYVFETAVSPTKVDKGGGMFDNVQAGNVQSTAAVKGLQPSAETYASGKGMSSGPLNRLIALNKKLDPKEFEKFEAEGKVGAK